MKRLQTTKTQFKVSDFISWKKNDELELSPSFQRRPVWSLSAKSYLLDTIVRGLPIPIIFIRDIVNIDKRKTIRQVVDGQQRIRTVLSFISPNLLEDFREDRDAFCIKRNHNKELANKQFDDLPTDVKRAILDYEFGVHVLPSDVDDKEVLKIFARMNATGVKLNNQELRNAEFFGEFKQSMYDLAYEQLERWRNWKIFSETNIARMEEVELTSDLVLLMLQGISTKNKKVIDDLYSNFDEIYRDKDLVETRFCNVMDSIDDLFGEIITKTEFNRKTLFYVLFALVYDLHYGLHSDLKKSKKTPLPSNLKTTLLDFNNRLLNDQLPATVQTGLTTRVSTSISRKPIFDYLKRKIRG